MHIYIITPRTHTQRHTHTCIYIYILYIYHSYIHTYISSVIISIDYATHTWDVFWFDTRIATGWQLESYARDNPSRLRPMDSSRCDPGKGGSDSHVDLIHTIEGPHRRPHYFQIKSTDFPRFW